MGLFDWFRRKRSVSAPTPPRNVVAPPSVVSAYTPPVVPPPLPKQAPSVIRVDYDANAYKPLSTADVKKAAAGQAFSNFWEFGRQSRIPSGVDPRTKLIDQALIGQGLLSAEDLARIHTLGDRMDDLRPERVGTHVVVGRAVEADKAERARIKAAKKAEAEARKKAHAERVSHNRRTDIVFLGRGVSAGLADRSSDSQKLAGRGLPALSTAGDVATAMGLPIPTLRWLAFHAEASTVCHYVQFTVPKKSGGTRTLSAPHEKLAAAQRWILDNVLSKLPTHDAAHGFVTGRSILTNATPHVGAEVVVNCDLTDFFPSVIVYRVIGLFKQIGYSPAVATIFGLLVTECSRRIVTWSGQRWYVAVGPRSLPQGACTSPAISNLVSRRLDARLSGLSNRMGLRYTRYADDLTFSGREKHERVGYLLAKVRHIVADEGFVVNEAKTRVLKQSARQTVTGVVVNDKPAVSKTVRRRLRAILHNAGKTGLESQNRTGDPAFAARIRGTVEFVHMVSPDHGAKLKTLWGAVA